MNALKSSRAAARLVLVWFAFFIGVATASPIVQPADIQMVCSAAGGMKLVIAAEDGADIKVSTGMDCPLCAAATGPGPVNKFSFSKQSSLAHALQSIAAAHIALVSAPPLPSRGPPSLFV
jgi:hypothetical protein